MSDYSTQLLLPSIYHGVPQGNYDGSSASFTGPTVEASSYYSGITNGQQTIAISASQFLGVISIQATLERNPEEDDWVTIYEYGDYSSAISENSMTTLLGNYVWLRANVNYFETGIINEVRAIY